MAKEESETKQEKRWNKQVTINKGGSGAVYCLGIIGAAIYYIEHATTFWLGLLGIIKAIFWPAILVYTAFQMLHL
jgi:hypothetical protein